MFVRVVFLCFSLFKGSINLFSLFYKYITIILQKYYKSLFIIFPLAPIPLIPSFPSLSSYAISSIVINLYFSVSATFWATNNGSKKSIKILAGDDAKFAPAEIIAS